MGSLKEMAFKTLTDKVLECSRDQNDEHRENIYVDSNEIQWVYHYACTIDIDLCEDGRLSLRECSLYEDKEGDGEYDFADRQLTELFYTIIDKECARLSDENQAQIATDRGYYDMISEYWVYR